MTKKKIRYSEFPAPEASVAQPARPVPLAAEPVPAADRPRAPVDLARALAAARAAEEAAATPRVVSARLTPARAGSAIHRPTPVRGNAAIPRLTPLRGVPLVGRPTPARAAIDIVQDAVPGPAAGAAPASPTLRDRARARSGTVDLLLFCVGQEWFGVELAVVEEAIDLPAVRHVPEMPPAMLGITTVRGALTSVYSPASALGIALGAPASALVFRRPRGRMGIAVDDVDDVHTMDLAQLRDAPTADTGDGIVLGVLRHRDSLLALVDAEALIAACQTVPAMETA